MIRQICVLYFFANTDATHAPPAVEIATVMIAIILIDWTPIRSDARRIAANDAHIRVNTAANPIPIKIDNGMDFPLMVRFPVIALSPSGTGYVRVYKKRTGTFVPVREVDLLTHLCDTRIQKSFCGFFGIADSGVVEFDLGFGSGGTGNDTALIT